MDRNSRLHPGAWLMLLPVAAWVSVILYYSVNVPWYDDFDPFPDFLRHWIAAESIQEKIRLLFQPNNEHRMVIGKLVTLAWYQLSGRLDFTFLHIAGACFTFGTLAILWRYYRHFATRWWYFLPVILLLFQFQYHLVFLWAICSLQHQPVIFFVCLSMYLLSGGRFGWAVLAGLCATFAMSNGIFVWAGGAAVLILRSDYKRLGAWILIGALAVGFYFHGLSAQGNESSIAFFIKNPHLSVLGFFAFLGGLFDFFPEKDIVTRSVLPVLMGLIVMIWIGLWLYRQLMTWVGRTFRQSAIRPLTFKSNFDKKNPHDGFLLGILVFLLANAFIIGLLRPRFGFFVMIVSNYKMYPALFLIVAYLTFMESSARSVNIRRGFGVALAASGLIWIISATTYLPVIAERSKYLTVNGYNQQRNGFGLGHVPFSKGAEYVDHLMKEMVAKNIYRYPEASSRFDEYPATATKAFSTPNVTVTARDSSIYGDDAQVSRSLALGDGQYVFAKNQKHSYFFKMTPHHYPGRNLLIQFDKGADVEIPFSSLPAGQYQLGIVYLSDGLPSGGILRTITIP